MKCHFICHCERQVDIKFDQFDLTIKQFKRTNSSFMFRLSREFPAERPEIRMTLHLYVHSLTTTAVKAA